MQAVGRQSNEARERPTFDLPIEERRQRVHDHLYQLIVVCGRPAYNMDGLAVGRGRAIS
jgi:hypothetical protein